MLRTAGVIFSSTSLTVGGILGPRCVAKPRMGKAQIAITPASCRLENHARFGANRQAERPKIGTMQEGMA